MAQTAEDLVKQAEKKLSGGFFSFFSSSTKLEDAASLYVSAANQYKLQKKWEDSANCYKQAAKLHSKMGDVNQEASYHVEAGNLIEKYSAKDARKSFTAAIDIYVKQGRFGQSAKLLKTMAEAAQREADYEEAITSYKKAADFFELDGYGSSQYSSCMLKYADLISFRKDNYDDAIKIYENEGHKALQNSLLQYGAKEHFFKAGILHLAKREIVDAKIALQRYGNIDQRISSSSEFKFLMEMLRCLESNNVDSFVGAIEVYDRTHKLDDWKVHFLYKVKESMEGLTNQATVDEDGKYDFS